MKKIIVFILIGFILTGCTDYKELENLASVTSIGVDYKDNQYQVTYEILNNKKENDKVIFESYTVDSKGSTISEAFIKAADKIKLYPYFAHVDFLAIGEDMARNHLEELVDFLLRENEIREKFFIAVTKDANILLKSQTKLDSVVSFAVKKLLDVNRYSYNMYSKTPFDDFIFNYKNWQIDNAVPYIEFKDETIEINKLVYFKGLKMQNFLNEKQCYLLNLLTKDNLKYYMSEEFNNEIAEISVMVNKKEIQVDNNSITFNIKAMGSLINNETRMNLKDERTYELLNQKFKEALEKDLMEYIDFNVDNNVDLLGIAKYNYIQNRVKTSTPWNNKKIIINLDFSLAKKGIIYDSIKA